MYSTRRRVTRWIPLLLLSLVLAISTLGCEGTVGVGVGIAVPGPYYGPYPTSVIYGGGPRIYY
jgi:hypothetical protein